MSRLMPLKGTPKDQKFRQRLRKGKSFAEVSQHRLMLFLTLIRTPLAMDV